MHMVAARLGFERPWLAPGVPPPRPDYKPSPRYVLTESTIPVRDAVLIPGLLPIFLHGCEIKSGRGLGTRLGTHSTSLWLAFLTSVQQRKAL